MSVLKTPRTERSQILSRRETAESVATDAENVPNPLQVSARRASLGAPYLERQAEQCLLHMNFDWDPDPSRLSDVISGLPSDRGFSSTVIRLFRDGRRKDGTVSREQLALEFPELRQVDLDVYYRPGNPDVRQWGYVELELETRHAHLHVHGDFDSFDRLFQGWITQLALRKTAAQELQELVSTLRPVFAPALFTHVEGSLKSGQLAAALSAAVVYVEDRLRSKVAPAGDGLTGTELALVAFKKPGLLVPPLSLANNAEDGVYLLLRGWMGLVRNLHGHQSSIPLSLDEAKAQLLGINYVFWVIDNAQKKT